VKSTPLCLGVSGSVSCVENRRRSLGGVSCATLNIQGWCNNLCDTAPDPLEYAARNQADIGWMQQTFAEAKSRRSAAIMFISQADPGFDASDTTRGPVRDPKTLAESDGQPDGFQEFLLALRDQVRALAKPVACVHGDSHSLRVDKPILDSQGARLENFTLRDFRRPPRERYSRRALAQGAGGPSRPRGLLVSTADRSGQPNRGSGAIACGTANALRGEAGLASFRHPPSLAVGRELSEGSPLRLAVLNARFLSFLGCKLLLSAHNPRAKARRLR